MYGPWAIQSLSFGPTSPSRGQTYLVDRDGDLLFCGEIYVTFARSRDGVDYSASARLTLEIQAGGRTLLAIGEGNESAAPLFFVHLSEPSDFLGNNGRTSRTRAWKYVMKLGAYGDKAAPPFRMNAMLQFAVGRPGFDDRPWSQIIAHQDVKLSPGSVIHVEIG